MYASQMYEPTPEWNARYRFNSGSYIDDMGAFFWYRGIRFNYLALLGLKARVCIYAGPAYYKNAETAAKELYNTYYQQKRWIGFYRRREHYLQSQFPIYKSLPRHIVRLVQETGWLRIMNR